MSKLAIYGGEKLKKTPFPQWPMYSERELTLVEEVIRSRKWWRIAGSKADELDREFARLHQADWALSVTTGTHAIELALAVLEIGAGDEVLIPSFTFMSTATAVLYCNAKPVPVDVDPETFCMDPAVLEQAITPATKAIIPVHMAGHSCDMDAICKIAAKHNLLIIEDASHAHGAEWKGKRVGCFGDIATFSFQNGKLATAGEGGAVMSRRPELKERAFLIHSVGRPTGDRLYSHIHLGSNYRMTELQAAVLLAQLERLEDQNAQREKNAAILDRLLGDTDGIKPQGKDTRVTLNTHYMYMFYYDAAKFGGMDRITFVDAMIAEGVPAFVAYAEIHKTEVFKENRFRTHFEERVDWNAYATPNAEKIAAEVIWLPHHLLLGTEEDMKDIARVIKKIKAANNKKKTK